MRELRIYKDIWDYSAMFNVECKDYRGRPMKMRCYLGHCEKEGYYINQGVACISDSYSKDEIEMLDRLAVEEPLRADDHVLVDGKEFVVKVRGNYSDAGYLIPAA